MMWLDPLRNLHAQLTDLEQPVGNLVWAAVEGQVSEEGHALADHFDEQANDLMGWLKEAQKALAGVLGNGQDRPDLDRASQALATCHERLNRIMRSFYCDLAAFERIDALNRLAAERRDEWGPWAQGVRDALDRCAPALHDIHDALPPCWGLFMTPAARLSVSAQASRIGPHIYVGCDQAQSAH